MIKGVNKKIIEINHPESPYFDRVILYVKPNTPTRSNQELSYEVDKYLKSITKNPERHKRKSTNPHGIDHSLGIMVGMAVVLTMVVVLILI